MGTLVVAREEPSAWNGDRLRAYEIEIDGIRRGKLRRQQELRFDLAEGTHRVRAAIDWSGSPTIEVFIPSDGEKRIVVAPGVNVMTAWRAFFSRTGWLKIDVED